MLDPQIVERQREIIEAFNLKAKNGIQILKDILNDKKDIEADQIAEFFIQNKKNLNLEFVGEYLSDQDAENQRVLEAFTAKIDFSEQSFTTGLRTFLMAFKLPGEAQKIDRLVQSFSKAYCSKNPGVVSNDDDAYILAFQAIMINTDLHNPNVAKKITVEACIKNLRDCNEGKGIAEDFLKEMYEDIQNEPFKFNFIKIAPAYEFNSKSLYKESAFKEMGTLLKSYHILDKPKEWLKKWTGYEGSVTLTDDKTNAKAMVQIYKPNVFSKWLFGEQPKVIIQPAPNGGKDSLEFAGQIAARFQSPVSIKSTYDYEQSDLEEAYSQNKSVLENKSTFHMEKFKDMKNALQEGKGVENDSEKESETSTFSR
jgi:guanine nucleotide exchange protein RalF